MLGRALSCCVRKRPEVARVGERPAQRKCWADKAAAAKAAAADEAKQRWRPGGSALGFMPERAVPRLDSAMRRAHERKAQGGVVDVLRRAALEAASRAWAESTQDGQDTTMRYFFEYMEVIGADASTYGAAAEGLVPSPEELMAEDEILVGFACYVVNFPRKDKEFNTGAYAGQCVSHVRSWYSAQARLRGRKPGSGGVWGGDRLGVGLARILKGLRKSHPSAEKKRRPVLLSHLKRVRARLDLEGSSVQAQFDRTLWAFFVTAWQGVRRSAELLGAEGSAWERGRSLHRGRIRIVKEGEQACFVVKLPPSKTDQEESKGFSMELPIRVDEEVNAGSAVLAMLSGAPLPAGVAAQDFPVFWNPVTRKALTYREAAEGLKRLLREIGEEELASGLHSLRIGGSTTLASLNASAATMGMFGLWGSDAYLGYVWASRGQMHDLHLRMGRTDVSLAGETSIR